MKCKCGKGYASQIDNLCKFCRENESNLTRAKLKKLGVKHQGDGLTLEQLRKQK